MTEGIGAALEAEHRRVQALYRGGRLDEAAAGYRDLTARLRAQGQAVLRVHLEWCLCHFIAKRYDDAIAVLQEARKIFPDASPVPENMGVCLSLKGDHTGAVTALNEAIRLGGETAPVHDALTRSHFHLGDLDSARHHGCRALVLKAEREASTQPVATVPDGPPPPFDPTRRAANVITFSLWGGNPAYLVGAVRNALLIPELYPGWTARFYVGDGVPDPVVEQLQRYGAQVVRRQGPTSLGDGLFWRFEVVGEPGIDRFLVRDADSIVNTQERAAVDEWAGERPVLPHHAGLVDPHRPDAGRAVGWHRRCAAGPGDAAIPLPARPRGDAERRSGFFAAGGVARGAVVLPGP